MPISFFTDSGISLNDLLGLLTFILKWVETLLEFRIFDEFSEESKKMKTNFIQSIKKLRIWRLLKATYAHC